MTEHDAFLAEMNNWANRAHRTAPGASVPPADLWSRILAQASPKQKETAQMNSLSTATIPAATIPLIETRSKQGFGHYLNLAATIALVIAVAVAGWFATMQLNQPAPPEPRLASISATPQSSEMNVCQIDSLTPEEALQILKNPFVYMNISDEKLNQTGLGFVIDSEITSPGAMPIIEVITDGPTMNISRHELAPSYAAGDGYLGCLVHGTNGQAWSFMDPIRVRQEILDRLPLFVTEEEALELITSMLSEPAIDSRWPAPQHQEYLDDKIVQLNPDYALAYFDDSAVVQKAYMETIIMVPTMIIDSDSEIVFAADAGGFPIVGNGYSQDYAGNIVLGKSELNGDWYVLGFFGP